MTQDDFTTLVCVVGLFGLVLGMILIAWEDGVRAGQWKKLRCKLGWHKTKVYKVNKYFCQYCRKPRKKPPLKVVDGGKKFGNNKFTF